MSAPEAELVRRFGSPLYVYDEGELRARCRALRNAFAPELADFFYAMKANSNPHLLGIVREEGLGIDAVSLGEVRMARHVGFAPTQISFNGNNVDDAEMSAVRAEGVHVIVDSLAQLARYGRLFPGTSVGVRLNPDIGAGHHDHVITGGPESKFGIDVGLARSILEVAAAHRLRIDGLQHHIGSGILDVAKLSLAMEVLLEVAPLFPELDFVDFGGGFGIPYRPLQAPLDLETFGRVATERIERFRAAYSRPVRVRFEPGRFVVATSGSLLVTVTAVKRAKKHTFIGTDSGFHHLIRPMAYGSYHRIENLSNQGGALEVVSVAGNICESGDLFAKERLLPECHEGDVLAIRDAGAYGYSMSSTYNLRPRPAEVLLSSPDQSPTLIRRRETIEDLLAP